jgi:hypothetical protein
MQKHAVILNQFDSFHTEVYRADEADAEIAETRGWGEAALLRLEEREKRIAELEQCGVECSEGFKRMQERIDALERALRSATLALIKKRAADAQWSQTVDAAVAEANAVLGSPTS